MPTWTRVADPSSATALLPAWFVNRMLNSPGSSFGLLLTTGDPLHPPKSIQPLITIAVVCISLYLVATRCAGRWASLHLPVQHRISVSYGTAAIEPLSEERGNE